MIDPNTFLAALAGGVPAIGAIYTFAKHLIKKSKAKKELYRQEILDHIKVEADKVREGLEIRIEQVENDLQVQKENIYKDLAHYKELYSSEIKVLGEKIENLRSDLSDQHSAMIGLLTKLINTK